MASAATPTWLPHAAVVVTLVLALAAVPSAWADDVDMVFLKSAVAKGAVCLDGTPPVYHFSPGSGSGANNWVVHMEGGGWCKTSEECAIRKGNFRGSSKYMKPLSFSGILGGSQKYNPDFYNWNRVKVRYCDGSSFTGDVAAVESSTNLHYRGARVWNAIIEDLLEKGMSKAQNALLSGCSAGGLAAILHCDKFSDLLPASVIFLMDFRKEFLAALPQSGQSRSLGMFIDSCFAHCQSGAQDSWLAEGSPSIQKTQIGKAVGDWFFERAVSQRIDCPYPCNQTCKDNEDD
ncbi:hypothetical protein ACQ4PT_030518 [Festuca glaucescens]